jgi:hypothetical protein
MEVEGECSWRGTPPSSCYCFVYRATLCGSMAVRKYASNVQLLTSLPHDLCSGSAKRAQQLVSIIRTTPASLQQQQAQPAQQRSTSQRATRAYIASPAARKPHSLSRQLADVTHLCPGVQGLRLRPWVARDKQGFPPSMKQGR